MAGPLSGTIAAPCAVHCRCVQRPARETQREREREEEEEKKRRRRRRFVVRCVGSFGGSRVGAGVESE
jgi:hypothetical protein